MEILSGLTKKGKLSIGAKSLSKIREKVTKKQRAPEEGIKKLRISSFIVFNDALN